MAKIEMTLDGPDEEVSALTAMAVERRILTDMHVVQQSNGAAPALPRQRRRRASSSQPFNPGARVVSKWTVKAIPGAIRGRRGSVVQSIRFGNGYRVTVKWDDEPGTPRSYPSSHLKLA